MGSDQQCDHDPFPARSLRDLQARRPCVCEVLDPRPWPDAALGSVVTEPLLLTCSLLAQRCSREPDQRSFMPSCKTCPMGPDGQASQVLAGHVPVTRSRGSMPAITATRVGATPPPSLAPPEPWDGALSPRPHRPGAWARGMGPPFTLRAAKRRSGRLNRQMQTAGCVEEDGGSAFGRGRAARAQGAPTARPPGGGQWGQSRLMEEKTARRGTRSSPRSCDKRRVELGFELWPATL